MMVLAVSLERGLAPRRKHEQQSIRTDARRKEARRPQQNEDRGPFDANFVEHAANEQERPESPTRRWERSGSWRRQGYPTRL